MIYDELKQYASKNVLRMHMPGHKGKIPPGYYMGFDPSLDITEITGFDNLHEASGIIKKSMEDASRLWHSRKSFYITGGSTCGILSGIRALTNRGDTVLCTRGCHMSVLHAIELCGLKVHFIMPDFIEEHGIISSVSPENVKKAISEFPDASLIIITSPTYEGIISDMESICSLAHENGIAVLADEAHGAHLDHFGVFKGGSVRAMADITVQSLHKTLPCPTQCAIIHVCGNLIDMERLSHQISVFETSSPSYLFLAAMDKFVHSDMENEFQAWGKSIDSFYSHINLKKLNISGNFLESDKTVFKYDKSKIFISTKAADISGFELFDILRDEYNIELEAAQHCGALAMTGLWDSENDLLRLADALEKIDNSVLFEEKKSLSFPFSKSEIIFDIESALAKDRKIVNAKNSAGKICGEYIWAYPPGIPILIPGELITPETADYISRKNTKLHSTFLHDQDEIAVL